jgi:hypothetical protein
MVLGGLRWAGVLAGEKTSDKLSLVFCHVRDRHNPPSAQTAEMACGITVDAICPDGGYQFDRLTATSGIIGTAVAPLRAAQVGCGWQHR